MFTPTSRSRRCRDGRFSKVRASGGKRFLIRNFRRGPPGFYAVGPVPLGPIKTDQTPRLLQGTLCICKTPRDYISNDRRVISEISNLRWKLLWFCVCLNLDRELSRSRPVLRLSGYFGSNKLQLQSPARPCMAPLRLQERIS